MLQPLMESILLAERALLYTLAFDLNVEHGYTHLVAGLTKLGLTAEHLVGEKEKKYFQHTQNMLNDRCLTRGGPPDPQPLAARSPCMHHRTDAPHRRE